MRVDHLAGAANPSIPSSLFRPRLLLWVLAPWLAVLLLKTFETWMQLTLASMELDLAAVLRAEVPIMIAGVMVTPPALWLGFQLPVARRAWRHVAMAVPAVIALATLANLLRTSLWLWLGMVSVESADGTSRMLLNLASVLHVDIINVSFIVAVGQLMFHLRERRERVLTAARLETQLAAARLETLQSKIQPHFLFNTLHTTGQLVRAGRSDDAMDVLERLGDLLRRALDARATLIDLRSEIDFARAYLEIEAIRFSDRLRIVWDVADDATGARVPALLLQPLVENAVRHGVARRTAAVTLLITVRREGGDVVIAVDDDGPGFASDMPTRVVAAGTRPGTGLRNTAQRLETAFNGCAVLDACSVPGGGARVTMRFPYREAA